MPPPPCPINYHLVPLVPKGPHHNKEIPNSTFEKCTKMCNKSDECKGMFYDEATRVCHNFTELKPSKAGDERCIKH